MISGTRGHCRDCTSLQTVVVRELADLAAANPDAGERERRRVAVSRRFGQVPERRVPGEFMALARDIGSPGFTRVHDVRHLFSTRAQAAGVSPLRVQDALVHATLEMTRRDTHHGSDDARAAPANLDLETPAGWTEGVGDGRSD